MKNLHFGGAHTFHIRAGWLKVIFPANWIAYVDLAEYSPELSNVHVI